MGLGINDLQAVMSFTNWDQLRLLQNPVFITLVMLPEQINRPDPVVLLGGCLWFVTHDLTDDTRWDIQPLEIGRAHV